VTSAHLVNALVASVRHIFIVDNQLAHDELAHWDSGKKFLTTFETPKESLQNTTNPTSHHNESEKRLDICNHHAQRISTI
jgi:hypothetical protein